MSLDPGLAVLLRLMADSGRPPLHEGTPADARRAMRALTVDSVQPQDVVAVGSVRDLDAGGVPARLYEPEGEPRATLVYFHGGGWVIGDLDTHDQTCRRICAGAGVRVLSVDYRLAPEHRFPAAVDDALAATRWARSVYGPVAVGGDSAGGNLAAVVAQSEPDIVAQLLIYPAVDAFGDYPSRTENAEGYFLEMPLMVWFVGHYLDGHVEADDVRLSPLRATSLAGQPPAMVVTAGFDPLRDEGEAYADALTAAGVRVDRVRYDAMIHGFVDMGPFSPAAAAAVEDVVARFAKLLESR